MRSLWSHQLSSHYFFPDTHSYFPLNFDFKKQTLNRRYPSTRSPSAATRRRRLTLARWWAWSATRWTTSSLREVRAIKDMVIILFTLLFGKIVSAKGELLCHYWCCSSKQEYSGDFSFLVHMRESIISVLKILCFCSREGLFTFLFLSHRCKMYKQISNRRRTAKKIDVSQNHDCVIKQLTPPSSSSSSFSFSHVLPYE